MSRAKRLRDVKLEQDPLKVLDDRISALSRKLNEVIKEVAKLRDDTSVKSIKPKNRIELE